ncbi:MAG: NifU family protein [Firmicutes bacterium]|jgi:Fe-S cluster biogenesis protein NfuA|nr:NifU family protein [Bacillota bacterium]
MVENFVEKNKLMEIIDSKIRPYMNNHNGDLSLVEVKDGYAKIKLYGACSGCPMADQSTREFIEEILSSHFPQIKRVVIDNEVSPDLIDRAKKILSKSR